MSEFRVGQRVYCIEPCEGLEFGKEYTVGEIKGKFVWIEGIGSGYASRFSSIDPLVEGTDDTPLDAEFWERVGWVIRVTTDDIWKYHFEALRGASGVLLYVFDGSEWASVKCPNVQTLGQLRRLVAAVLGEGE